MGFRDLGLRLRVQGCSLEFSAWDYGVSLTSH